MSFGGFGVSVGDLVAIGTFAWNVYRACKGASAEFEEVSHEVITLHIAIKELEDETGSKDSILNRADDTKKKDLEEIIRNCRMVLTQLEKLLTKYKSLGTKSKRTWDRIKFGAEGLQVVREKLTFYTSGINLFLTTLGAGSLGRIEKKLDEIVEEIRTGKREPTVLTAIDDDGDEAEAHWNVLKSELLEDGFTRHDIEVHRLPIKAYIQELVNSGHLQETGRSSIPLEDNSFHIDAARSSAEEAVNGQDLSHSFELPTETYMSASAQYSPTASQQSESSHPISLRLREERFDERCSFLESSNSASIQKLSSSRDVPASGLNSECANMAREIDVPMLDLIPQDPESRTRRTDLISEEAAKHKHGAYRQSIPSVNGASMASGDSEAELHNCGAFGCPYYECNLKFETPAKLQEHKRIIHHLSAPFISDTSTSARISEEGRHICTRVNPSTNEPCSIIFRRPYDLARHEDAIHNAQKTSFRCPFCNERRVFSLPSALTRHLRVVHPNYYLQAGVKDNMPDILQIYREDAKQVDNLELEDAYASLPSLKRRASGAFDEYREDVSEEYDEFGRLRKRTINRRGSSPAMASYHSSPITSPSPWGDQSPMSVHGAFPFSSQESFGMPSPENFRYKVNVPPATPPLAREYEDQSRTVDLRGVPKLDRTMSDVYNDELYNPKFTIASTSFQKKEPISMPRYRSGTEALDLPLQHKMPKTSLEEGAPRTISPKDALLDYDDESTSPLFLPQDSTAYRIQHTLTQEYGQSDQVSELPKAEECQARKLVFMKNEREGQIIKLDNSVQALTQKLVTTERLKQNLLKEVVGLRSHVEDLEERETFYKEERNHLRDIVSGMPELAYLVGQRPASPMPMAWPKLESPKPESPRNKVQHELLEAEAIQKAGLVDEDQRFYET